MSSITPISKRSVGLLGVVFAIAVTAVFLSSGMARAQDTVDQVVASVDGEPITLREVIEFAAVTGNPIQTDDLATSPAAQAALKGLIGEKLLEQEVKKYEDKVDDEQIDHYLKDIRQQRHMSEAEFRASLQSAGITYDEMRKRARMDLEKAYMIQQQVREKIEIPDADVKAFYDAHRQDFTVEKERLKLAQILIAVPNNATPEQIAAAQKKADDIRSRALKGQDFGDLAHRYSDDESKANGGELGWFGPADVKDQILAAVKNLKPGQVSAVIRTEHGFHIVKLEDHEVPGLRPYSEMKTQIREMMIDRAAQARLQTWVETELIKQHYVETLY
ncbi:MAG TPA: peptidylprolyl isomerase [Candidatus Binataceae bacterium]|nr:peptidylprolyl isomerase [Candidatus Binataceae bacterium]